MLGKKSIDLLRTSMVKKRGVGVLQRSSQLALHTMPFFRPLLNSHCELSNFFSVYAICVCESVIFKFVAL